MLDGFMDIDAGFVEIGPPYGANRCTIEERLSIMERYNEMFSKIEDMSTSQVT